MSKSPDTFDETPHPDAVLEMLGTPQMDGSTCALLTPAIRARLREMAPGQVLEVRVDDPAARDFAAFAAAMDRLQSRKLWVHCAANMRVTAFVGIYRARHLRWKKDAAFELMRSVWEPDAVWSEFIKSQLGGERAD